MTNKKDQKFRANVEVRGSTHTGFDVDAPLMESVVIPGSEDRSLLVDKIQALLPALQSADAGQGHATDASALAHITSHRRISYVAPPGPTLWIPAEGHARLQRRAIISGIVLGALMIACYTVLAKFNQLTGNSVDPAEIKYTKRQMYYVGLFNFVGCGFALLLLAITVFFRINLRGQLAVTGRLPLPIIVMVGLGYALTFYFNGTLIWAFYANIIPFELVTTKWYYIIFMVFPNYLCRGLSSLPLTATMLRITSIYFGVEERLTSSNLNGAISQCITAAGAHAWAYLFVFVMLLPCIALALYDSIDVLLRSVVENNEQLVSYLIYLFVTLLCDFLDLWQVFCMLLLRSRLKRFDLDNSKILVLLSSLYLTNSVLAYVRVATPLTNYLVTHIIYTVCLYIQMCALYFYSYRTLQAMLARGGSRRNCSSTSAHADGSKGRNFVQSQRTPYFNPVLNEFTAGPST